MGKDIRQHTASVMECSLLKGIAAWKNRRMNYSIVCLLSVFSAIIVVVALAVYFKSAVCHTVVLKCTVRRCLVSFLLSFCSLSSK